MLWATNRLFYYRTYPADQDPGETESGPGFDAITHPPLSGTSSVAPPAEDEEEVDPSFNTDSEAPSPAIEPEESWQQARSRAAAQEKSAAATTRPLGHKNGLSSNEPIAKVAQQTTQTAVKRTVTNQLAVIGSRIAAATPAWMIQAGLLAAQALRTKKGQRIVQILIIIFLFGPAILFVMIAGTRINQSNQLGPSETGGTRVQAQTDSYTPAAATQLGGLIISTSVESINQFSQAAHTLLTKSPPKGAQVTQALAVLAKIDQLKDTLQANTYRDDRQATAQLASDYKKLVQELMVAIYPGRKELRDKVMSLVSSQQITLATAAGCNPERDLQGYGLSEQTLTVIVAAASQSKITITCLISGHRKFVGKPPSQGYPRCGDLKNDPRVATNTSQSYHCTGRAIDISPNATVQNYLQANKAALHIRFMQLESEANHLHIEVDS